MFETKYIHCATMLHFRKYGYQPSALRRKRSVLLHGFFRIRILLERQLLLLERMDPCLLQRHCFIHVPSRRSLPHKGAQSPDLGMRLLATQTGRPRHWPRLLFSLHPTLAGVGTATRRYSLRTTRPMPRRTRYRPGTTCRCRHAPLSLRRRRIARFYHELPPRGAESRLPDGALGFWFVC